MIERRDHVLAEIPHAPTCLDRSLSDTGAAVPSPDVEEAKGQLLLTDMASPASCWPALCVHASSPSSSVRRPGRLVCIFTPNAHQHGDVPSEQSPAVLFRCINLLSGTRQAISCSAMFFVYHHRRHGAVWWAWSSFWPATASPSTPR